MAVVLLGGCGGDDSSSSAPATSAPPPVVASAGVTTSPFGLGTEVPDGYRLVSARVGSDGTAPGDGEGGDPEPFTVLLGGSEADLAVVVVSATGFDGSAEGLERLAVPSFEREALTVDDRPGRYTPPAPAADDADRWAELVVDRGDEVAVRVAAESATLDQLIEVLAAVDLDEAPRRAPAVPEPPADLAVLGSAHLEWLLAEDVVVTATDGSGSGPEGAHVAGWTSAGAELVVMTLPFDALDPEVLRVDLDGPEDRRAGRVLEVAGRRAVVVDDEGPSGPRTTVLVETTWGDHLVVMGSGPFALDEDELVELAASVTRIDEVSWAEFVEAAAG